MIKQILQISIHNAFSKWYKLVIFGSISLLFGANLMILGFLNAPNHTITIVDLYQNPYYALFFPLVLGMYTLFAIGGASLFVGIIMLAGNGLERLVDYFWRDRNV